MESEPKVILCLGGCFRVLVSTGFRVCRVSVFWCKFRGFRFRPVGFRIRDPGLLRKGSVQSSRLGIRLGISA